MPSTRRTLINDSSTKKHKSRGNNDISRSRSSPRHKEPTPQSVTDVDQEDEVEIIPNPQETKKKDKNKSGTTPSKLGNESKRTGTRISPRRQDEKDSSKEKDRKEASTRMSRRSQNIDSSEEGRRDRSRSNRGSKRINREDSNNASVGEKSGSATTPLYELDALEEVLKSNRSRKSRENAQISASSPKTILKKNINISELEASSSQVSFSASKTSSNKKNKCNREESSSSSTSKSEDMNKSDLLEKKADDESSSCSSSPHMNTNQSKKSTELMNASDKDETKSSPSISKSKEIINSNSLGKHTYEKISTCRSDSKTAPNENEESNEIHALSSTTQEIKKKSNSESGSDGKDTDEKESQNKAVSKEQDVQNEGKIELTTSSLSGQVLEQMNNSESGNADKDTKEKDNHNEPATNQQDVVCAISKESAPSSNVSKGCHEPESVISTKNEKSIVAGDKNPEVIDLLSDEEETEESSSDEKDMALDGKDISAKKDEDTNKNKSSSKGNSQHIDLLSNAQEETNDTEINKKEKHKGDKSNSNSTMHSSLVLNGEKQISIIDNDKAKKPSDTTNSCSSKDDSCTKQSVSTENPQKIDLPSDESETNNSENDKKDKLSIKKSSLTSQDMDSGSSTDQYKSPDKAKHTAKISDSEEVSNIKNDKGKKPLDECSSTKKEINGICTKKGMRKNDNGVNDNEIPINNEKVNSSLTNDASSSSVSSFKKDSNEDISTSPPKVGNEPAESWLKLYSELTKIYDLSGKSNPFLDDVSSNKELQDFASTQCLDYQTFQRGETNSEMTKEKLVFLEKIEFDFECGVEKVCSKTGSDDIVTSSVDKSSCRNITNSNRLPPMDLCLMEAVTAEDTADCSTMSNKVTTVEVKVPDKEKSPSSRRNSTDSKENSIVSISVSETFQKSDATTPMLDIASVAIATASAATIKPSDLVASANSDNLADTSKSISKKQIASFPSADVSKSDVSPQCTNVTSSTETKVVEIISSSSSINPSHLSSCLQCPTCKVPLSPPPDISRHIHFRESKNKDEMTCTELVPSQSSLYYLHIHPVLQTPSCSLCANRGWNVECLARELLRPKQQSKKTNSFDEEKKNDSMENVERCCWCSKNFEDDDEEEENEMLEDVENEAEKNTQEKTETEADIDVTRDAEENNSTIQNIPETVINNTGQEETNEEPILLFCDSCPRSFCQSCLNILKEDISGKNDNGTPDEKWSCPVCLPPSQPLIQMRQTAELILHPPVPLEEKETNPVAPEEITYDWKRFMVSFERSGKVGMTLRESKNTLDPVTDLTKGSQKQVTSVTRVTSKGQAEDAGIRANDVLCLLSYRPLNDYETCPINVWHGYDSLISRLKLPKRPVYAVGLRKVRKKKDIVKKEKVVVEVMPENKEFWIEELNRMEAAIEEAEEMLGVAALQKYRKTIENEWLDHEKEEKDAKNDDEKLQQMKGEVNQELSSHCREWREHHERLMDDLPHLQELVGEHCCDLEAFYAVRYEQKSLRQLPKKEGKVNEDCDEKGVKKEVIDSMDVETEVTKKVATSAKSASTGSGEKDEELIADENDKKEEKINKVEALGVSSSSSASNNAGEEDERDITTSSKIAASETSPTSFLREEAVSRKLPEESKENQEALPEPDWKISADLELKKRDQKEGVPQGYFWGASGYKASNSHIYSADPYQTSSDESECDNDGFIEDINATEAALTITTKNSPLSHKCRWSQSAQMGNRPSREQYEKALRADNRRLERAKAKKKHHGKMKWSEGDDDDEDRQEVMALTFQSKQVERTPSPTSSEDVPGSKFKNLNVGSGGNKDDPVVCDEESDDELLRSNKTEKQDQHSKFPHDPLPPSQVPFQPEASSFSHRKKKKRIRPIPMYGHHRRLQEPGERKEYDWESYSSEEEVGTATNEPLPKHPQPCGGMLLTELGDPNPVDVSSQLTDKLKPHQREGVSFLWRNICGSVAELLNDLPPSSIDPRIMKEQYQHQQQQQHQHQQYQQYQQQHHYQQHQQYQQQHHYYQQTQKHPQMPHQMNAMGPYAAAAGFASPQRAELVADKVRGCILAHNMGLGKSFQVIALLHTLFTHPALVTRKNHAEPHKRIFGRILLCVPVNTLTNWEDEFNLWVNFGSKDSVLSSTRQRERCQIPVYNANNHLGYSRYDLVSQWYNDEKGGVMLMSFEVFRSLTNRHKKKRKKRRHSSEMEDMVTRQLHKAILHPGPDLIIIDEAHQALKSSVTGISKAMHQISTTRRIALTGTPLQNDLIEYYRMVKWCRPIAFQRMTLQQFDRTYNQPILAGMKKDSLIEEVTKMQNLTKDIEKELKGFVHRKTNSILRNDLPFMQQAVMAIRQSRLQGALMREHKKYQRNTGQNNFLDFCAKMKPVFNHPGCLLMGGSNGDGRQSPVPGVSKNESNSTSDEDQTTKNPPSSKQSNTDTPTVSGQENIAQTEDWWLPIYKKHGDDMLSVHHGGKIVVLLDILMHADKIGDKVVVFAQCLKSLDYIEHILNKPGWDLGDSGSTPTKNKHISPTKGSWRKNIDYLRIDGGTTASERGELITSFNREKETNTDNTAGHRKSSSSNYHFEKHKVFLISTRAGGIGVNLVGANRVVLFDTSWNPAVDLQALYRCYRYGQKKPVYVYRLLIEGSLEEKIYSRQVNKTGLSHRVIDMKNPEAHFSAAELSNLMQLDDWVQCDMCDKWRMLPPGVQAPNNPDDDWYCSMNTHDAPRSKCAAKEESKEWYYLHYRLTPLNKVGEAALKAAGGTLGITGSSNSVNSTDATSTDNSPSSIGIDSVNKAEHTERDVILKQLLECCQDEKQSASSKTKSKKKSKRSQACITKYHFHDALLNDEDDVDDANGEEADVAEEPAILNYLDPKVISTGVLITPPYTSLTMLKDTSQAVSGYSAFAPYPQPLPNKSPASIEATQERKRTWESNMSNTHVPMEPPAIGINPLSPLLDNERKKFKQTINPNSLSSYSSPPLSLPIPRKKENTLNSRVVTDELKPIGKGEQNMTAFSNKRPKYVKPDSTKVPPLLSSRTENDVITIVDTDNDDNSSDEDDALSQSNQVLIGQL
eukprot:CAMPEP_0194363742 /NCGR_PEP_ID=MMETSP0174-20130528/11594_1 /TAXON_ID=216777 /ORGANISM="Proboscia alata, Strain PI-D3" /LENGTH=3050 /DNA_ID=CAMNT_0039137361 /DNA_START=650 /DNA_END=9802 /DNA_ORIENTATION=+